MQVIINQNHFKLYKWQGLVNENCKRLQKNIFNSIYIRLRERGMMEP